MNTPRLPQRRRLAAGLALAAAGSWLLPLSSRAGSAAPALRERLPLMGTQVDIVLPAEAAEPARLQAAWQAARAEMQRLATMMSRYRDDSLVAELARQAGRRPVAVPPEMMAVLQRAQALARDSGGAFDATVGGYSHWHFEDPSALPPDATQLQADARLVGHRDLLLDPAAGQAWLRRPGMRLDLGGVAKLPILQAGLDTLAAHGVQRALLNGGGDVLALAGERDAPWRIGIRDAAHPERLLAVLPLRRGVVASSGDYERARRIDGQLLHHVLDPATGRPTVGVHGVSLVADHSEVVNGLGAAAMVLGPQRGPAWLAQRVSQSLLVRADGSLWASPALAGRLLPPPGEDHVRGLA